MRGGASPTCHRSTQKGIRKVMEIVLSEGSRGDPGEERKVVLRGQRQGPRPEVLPGRP